MQKVLDTILSVLKILGGILEFLPIQQLKGWRTIIVNAVIVVIGFMESLDFINLIDAACLIISSVTDLIGREVTCNPETINGFWLMILGFLNAALRAITNTEPGEGESNRKDKENTIEPIKSKKLIPTKRI